MRRIFVDATDSLVTTLSVMDHLYERVNRVATQMTAELGRPVTAREALLRLLEANPLELGDFEWSFRFKHHSPAPPVK